MIMIIIWIKNSYFIFVFLMRSTQNWVSSSAARLKAASQAGSALMSWQMVGRTRLITYSHMLLILIEHTHTHTTDYILPYVTHIDRTHTHTHNHAHIHTKSHTYNERSHSLCFHGPPLSGCSSRSDSDGQTCGWWWLWWGIRPCFFLFYMSWWQCRHFLFDRVWLDLRSRRWGRLWFRWSYLLLTHGSSQGCSQCQSLGFGRTSSPWWLACTPCLGRLCSFTNAFWGFPFGGGYPGRLGTGSSNFSFGFWSNRRRWLWLHLCGFSLNRCRSKQRWWRRAFTLWSSKQGLYGVWGLFPPHWGMIRMEWGGGRVGWRQRWSPGSRGRGLATSWRRVAWWWRHRHRRARKPMLSGWWGLGDWWGGFGGKGRWRGRHRTDARSASWRWILRGCKGKRFLHRWLVNRWSPSFCFKLVTEWTVTRWATILVSVRWIISGQNRRGRCTWERGCWVESWRCVARLWFNSDARLGHTGTVLLLRTAAFWYVSTDHPDMW